MLFTAHNVYCSVAYSTKQIEHITNYEAVVDDEDVVYAEDMFMVSESLIPFLTKESRGNCASKLIDFRKVAYSFAGVNNPVKIDLI